MTMMMLPGPLLPSLRNLGAQDRDAEDGGRGPVRVPGQHRAQEPVPHQPHHRGHSGGHLR